MLWVAVEVFFFGLVMTTVGALLSSERFMLIFFVVFLVVSESVVTRVLLFGWSVILVHVIDSSVFTVW